MTLVTDIESRLASFWSNLHSEFPGSIPEDIIFLQEYQVRLDSQPGFGWAPISWENTDDPGLFRTPRGRHGYTNLIPDQGLLVRLPGILLRPPSEAVRRQFLGMDGQDAQCFAVSNKGLIEWYSVFATTHDQNVELLAQVGQRQSQLAIVLQDRPESAPWIALLVEIYEAASGELDFDHSPRPVSVIYKCQVIRRIRVCREPTVTTLEGFTISHLPATASERLVNELRSRRTTILGPPQRLSASHELANSAPLAEWTSNEQSWIVDGYFQDRDVFLPDGADGLKLNALETSSRSEYRNSHSPLEEAWRYYMCLPKETQIYPRLEKVQVAYPGYQLLAVSFFTTSSWNKFWNFAHPTLSQPPRVSFAHDADASDLASQLIIGLVKYHFMDDLIGRFPKQAVTQSLNKLIRFYAVLLWYSAYESWESELALLVENNAYRICEALSPLFGGTPPGNTVPETDFALLASHDNPLWRFLVERKGSKSLSRRRDTALSNLLTGFQLITSDQDLSFAVHVHDEDSIQKCPLSMVQRAHQLDDTDLSPIQLALSGVEFLSYEGFPQSTVSKSLGVLNRLRPTWPSLTLSQLETLRPALTRLTEQRLRGTRTEPARVPDNDDAFWDVVTGASIFFLKDSFNPATRFNEVYSWEVPDLLSVIASSKPPGDNQPQQQSLLWSPLQVLSELEATVTITGCADTFDVETCGTLAYKLWGEDGLDALRLIAAGAFLRVMSRQAYDSNPGTTTVQEMDSHIVNVLKSQGCKHRLKQPAEEIVLEMLFGTKADTILSSTGESPIFPLSITSKSVLVIRYPLTSIALREALAWLCAALRPHPYARPGSTRNSIMQSRGSFHTIRADHDLGLLVWNLKSIEDISADELGSHRCWTALFVSGLVVPHVIRRQWGKGLGMSYDLMIHLSASETYIWADDRTLDQRQGTFQARQIETSSRELPTRSGGYFLSGYRTALIPISSSEDGTQIQWHLETSDDWTTIVDHTNLQSLRRDWLKVQDISKFNNTTCYVGWYQNAEVLLGTDSVSQIPTWSGAKTREKTLHEASRAVQVAVSTGAAALSPINVQATVGKTYNWLNNVQRYEPSTEYNNAIRFERRKTALVIDYDKKRAYLVPKLSLMLHLCRVEALRSRPTENTSPATSLAIPAAAPSVDGYEAALRVLSEHENTTFIGSETTADKTTLRQLFLQVHHDLVKAAGLLESPKRFTILGSRIFATELLGLLDRPDTGTPLSEIQDPLLLAWVRMAALADAVLICSDLGAAIRPVAVGNDQTCECYELPHNRYFLAAHMECLKDILERRKCDIEDLARCGMLDFGEGYKMRLNARQLWTRGRHERHGRFWDKRAEIIQVIHKEDGIDGLLRRVVRLLRRVLRTDDEADQQVENPYSTGVVVFGIRG